MNHDLKWLMSAIKAICMKHLLTDSKDLSNFSFDKMSGESETKEIFRNFPIQEPDKVWFSVLNTEVEGYYSEVRTIQHTNDILNRHIARYNEQQDVKKLNIILFEEMFINIFKILRAINTHAGHLIVVGLRGFATNDLIKLATFISQKAYHALEMHPDFTDEEWRKTIREKLIVTSQNDQQVCFIIEEYRMT